MRFIRITSLVLLTLITQTATAQEKAPAGQTITLWDIGGSSPQLGYPAGSELQEVIGFDTYFLSALKKDFTIDVFAEEVEGGFPGRRKLRIELKALYDRATYRSDPKVGALFDTEDRCKIAKRSIEGFTTTDATLSATCVSFQVGKKKKWGLDISVALKNVSAAPAERIPPASDLPANLAP
jgi:hypothetical protein